MAVSESDLELITQTLERVGADVDDPLKVLREQFPALRFVRLDGGDFEGHPIRSVARFNLYLLDTREHCPVLTDDVQSAGAVVVTQREEPR